MSFQSINQKGSYKQNIILKNIDNPLHFPILPPKGSTISLTSNKEKIKSITNIKMHTRYQQMIDGIPIWRADFILNHTQKNWQITGQWLTHIQIAPFAEQKKYYSDNELIQKMIRHYQQNSDIKINFRSKKYYWFLNENKKLVSAILIELFFQEQNRTSHPYIFIDRSSGNILEEWDALAQYRMKGIGFGGNKKTGRYEYGKDYPAFKVEYRHRRCYMENKNVRIIDLKHSFDYSKDKTFSYPCSLGVTSRNTYKEINGAYSPINDAYVFTNATLTMYQKWYGVKALPYQLMVKVHYKNNYNNALWYNNMVLLGDGDNNHYPYTSLNIIAHEISHGLSKNYSKLNSKGKSLATAEFFSDIAGEVSELFMYKKVDWLFSANSSKIKKSLRFFEHPEKDTLSYK
jgi:Zn-dependent metalloprotease